MNYNNKEGICSCCKEWTSVIDSCCGYPVWCDGVMIGINEEEEMDDKNDNIRDILSNS